jgi:hypothetical protein
MISNQNRYCCIDGEATRGYDGGMQGTLTPKICWVCKKSVPQKSMVDAFGFFAHEKCLESETANSHSQTAIAAKQQA